MRQKKGMITLGVVVGIILMFVIAIVGVVMQFAKEADDNYNNPGRTDKVLTLEQLYEGVERQLEVADIVKASIDLSDTSLYDELPDIDKYPLQVTSRADVVLEIFSSPEKAGDRVNKESWLIEVAEAFNKSGVVTSGGKTCGIAVRNVSSGLAADYIISNKAVPHLFSPSSEIWGALIQSNGRTANLEAQRLVGNTAGVMVKKSFRYSDIDAIIEDVVAGKLNMGYTNPQASTAGANMLLTVLNKYGKGDMTSDSAVAGFSKFQSNIPYVAYNTVQMVKSAGTGALDCMVAEYQSYVNNPEFVKDYDFIPYGMRHDNPLYSCLSLSSAERECLDAFIGYATGNEAQKLASDYGFNGNQSYKNAFDCPSGNVIEKAEKIWKQSKDSGKDIVAVFVADCSGSMDGDPMLQLKESLTNGMKYINENNFVGLVSYSSNVVKELDIAQFTLEQKSYFQGAINRLRASGNTHTYDAIAVAMKMIEDAKEMHPDAKCMIFLLSDGQEQGGTWKLYDIRYAVEQSGVPIYTIGYGSGADSKSLSELSSINEAATISADSDDIVYKLKSLFNAQL